MRLKRLWALGVLAALEILAPLARGGSSEMQTVVVKPGDTLWSIAQKYLKDPARWDEIIKHNRLPSSDPTVALPGMTLMVPVDLIKVDLRAAHLIYRLNRVLVRHRETAEWKQALPQMELYRDDSLRTLEDSKAKVRFFNNDLLELDANAMALIKPVQKDYIVELKKGGVFLGKAKILTATAKITPKLDGTKYLATVREDLSTLVEVVTGKADVHSEGKSVEVGAGLATLVRPGAAPSTPTKIPDLPAFQTRVAGIEELKRAKIAVADFKAPAAASMEARAPKGLAQINTEVSSLSIGEPISGYHLQFAASQDFTRPLIDRTYDMDTPMEPADIKLPPGRYWYRIAPIDLLGERGRFGEPKPWTQK